MDEHKRIWLLNKCWDAQQQEGYISDSAVRKISAQLELSEIETEGVISFYHFFRRTPGPKYTIYLNSSILSYFNGFEEVKQAFEEAIGAGMGSIDADGTFALYETSCIGLSDREPAALINFLPFTSLTPRKVFKVVEELKAGVRPELICDTIEESIYAAPGHHAILLREFTPGHCLEPLKKLSPEEVVAMVKESGLTGRGGAFFPTGMKWESCRKAAGQPKYIVCNADEGEPGSFKDRALLNLMPELLIEGMIVAAYAVGATEGIIYLRAEYFWLLPKLSEAVETYRQQGWLGQDITHLGGIDFDIRIQMGAGAYICGEETALLESLEGKRGEPRVKTFFPTDKGFLGKPTVINNVETLCAAARIVELGVDEFRSAGTPLSAGTKLLCIAGDCKYPGIYEVAWGIKVREILHMCGAEDTRFIQMSGPSGELISIDEMERTLSCEDIRCEGSVMIFNTHRDLFTILHNYSKFFTYESCGICTPCRAGNPQLLRMIEQLMKGKATERDVSRMLNWSAIVKNTSRCGLGNTAPNSIIQAIKKFPHLIAPLLAREGLMHTGFDLSKATEDFNDVIDGK